MKPQEIQVGRIYHDGKVGLREVLAIGGLFVSYRLLAEKAKREFPWHGVERTISLAAFAVWAKVECEPAGAQVLLRLQAAFFDFDPKGLCLPPRESLEAAVMANRRRDLYFRSVDESRAHLAAQPEGSDVAQAWALMNGLEMALDQEHFPQDSHS